MGREGRGGEGGAKLGVGLMAIFTLFFAFFRPQAFSEPIMLTMGVPAGGGALHDFALQYLVIRAWAAPAVLLSTVGQGAFRGLQDTKVGPYIARMYDRIMA